MKRHWLILFAIILLGLALRLFILSYRGSLWFDEAFSVHFASMDIGRMLSYLRFENNPPLYFILLHFWMRIFGNSELAVRMPSMIFGVAGIPLVYALGKRLHNSTAGMFAAFLTAISSFQVFYSTETRMYSLYMFLAILLAYLFISEKKNRPLPPSLFLSLSIFFTMSALVWVHTTAWLIVGAFVLYLLWHEHFNFKQFFILHSSFVISTALSALLFLPWGLYFFITKIVTPVSQGWIFFLPPDKNFFFSILQSFISFGEESAFIVTLLSVLILGLLICALRKSEKATVFLLFWLFTPLMVGFAFNSGVLRYFIACSPALYLLLGIGFARLRETRKLPAWPIPFLFFFLIVPSYVLLSWSAHHSWDSLARWIEQHSAVNCELSSVNCLILVNPHSEMLPLERYYHGTLPLKGFYPREDSDNRDLRIVKTNWRAIVTKENIRALADYTKGFNRVFLVSGEIDLISRNVVPLWFWEHGWERIASQEFGRNNVMLLER